MQHFVVGLGEVGGAVQSILGCDGFDPSKSTEKSRKTYDMLHICFPYSPNFGLIVRSYIDAYQPKYVLVHSTVPVGTCGRLGVAHSPIRGRHPDLKESILNFKKYIGGEGANDIADELAKYGMKTEVVATASETEAGKLFDLMQYGMSVLLNKEIWQFCQDNQLDFDTVYTKFNQSYNDGYASMGYPQFIRPILEYMEGKIGGHCVVQMMSLLETYSAKRIIQANRDL